MIKVFTNKSLGFTNQDGIEETVGVGFGQVSDSCASDLQFKNALKDGSLQVFNTTKQADELEKSQSPKTVGEALELLTVAKLTELSIEKGLDTQKGAKKQELIDALLDVVTLDELLK